MTHNYFPLAFNRKLSSIEKFDPVANRWVMVGRLPTGPKVGMATAVLGNNLFIAGGFNKEMPGIPVTADVSCLDLENHRYVFKS